MKSFFIALSVFSAGLVSTVVLVGQQQQAVQAIAQARFMDEVRSSSDALAQRLATYAEVVASGRDIFLVNPELTYQQFNVVAKAHHFRQNYPELRNLSFARWVRHADLEAFEKRLARQARDQGLPERSIIHPRLERENHYIIEYLWPLEGNQSIWGLDIASQPANLAAVEKGRASGKMVLSAPFGLLQEPSHPLAVVLRAPVFVQSGSADRQAPRFLGSVTVTLRINEMLDAIYSQGFFNGVALRLDDVGALDDEGRSAPVQFMGQLGRFPSVPELQQKDWKVERRVLEVQGRRWRLSFVPQHTMLSPAEAQIPLWTGVGGMVVSGLLGLLAYLLLRQRAQALTQVDRSLQELQRSEARFRAVFNQAAVGVSLTDMQTGRYLRTNQRYCDITGYSNEDLACMNAQNITLAEDWPLHAQKLESLQKGEIPSFRLEKRLQRKDGEQVWVELTVSPVFDVLLSGHPTPETQKRQGFYIGVMKDITAHRHMQDALRESEKRLRDILDHLPVGVLLVEFGERIVFRNRRFVHITGYTEDLLPSTLLWWNYAYPHAAQRERIQAHWMALCEKAKETNGVIAAGEYEVRCADGRTCILDISGVLLAHYHLVFFEDVTAHRAAQEEVSYLVHHDPLTELPNRAQLLDILRHTLASCAKQQCQGALLLLDLDHFKTLNETRGHDWGDQLLRQVAERLRHCMHEGASVARHGDDEFVVLLQDLADDAQAAALQARSEGERLLQILRTPYMLGEEPYHGTVSMGVVVFHGIGQSAQELLAHADLAMNQAKTAGRNGLCFYDPRVQAVVQERATIEQELRLGMQEGQFELYYQAQMEQVPDVGEHITGCEALLRWRHPHKGFISPATFIPLAEDTGLILPLGQWVLQTACAQLARWAHKPPLSGITLAVNVSARQFHQSDFVEQVLTALASTGADAQHLELELTEGLLLQDVEDTIAKMQQLRSYGVRFSLDDFGTGYSSLAYLKRLPLDQLKIDQSFVRDVLTDPNDAAIARTIAALGASLGLRVVAEGVETQAQRDFLAHNNCHIWQGYFFSRPVPVAEFEALVLPGTGA